MINSKFGISGSNSSYRINISCKKNNRIKDKTEVNKTNTNTLKNIKKK